MKRPLCYAIRCTAPTGIQGPVTLDARAMLPRSKTRWFAFIATALLFGKLCLTTSKGGEGAR